MKNPIIQNYLEIQNYGEILSQDGRNKRLKIGLEVGFGVLGLVISILLISYWNLRGKWWPKMRTAKSKGDDLKSVKS